MAAGAWKINTNAKLKLGTGSIRSMMDKHLKTVGMDSSISPKTLRNTFAVHMINNGCDLRSVQELMGHKNMSTTEIYKRAATAVWKAQRRR